MSKDIPKHLRYLTVAQVCEITSYCRQHLARLIKKQAFPRPVRMGLNRVQFREADVMAWLAEREAQDAHRSDDERQQDLFKP